MELCMVQLKSIKLLQIGFHLLDLPSSIFYILSDIGTPICRLAKFVVPILEPLTTNEYTIKDSFSFAEELQNFDSKLVMASFESQSHSLITLPCKKQLTCVWTIYFKIGLILMICRKSLSGSYLLGLYLNHLSYLIKGFINSMMKLQWVPHQGLRLLKFFSVVMKKFGFKIVLLNLNLLCIKNRLIIHSYFFVRNIASKNSEIIKIVDTKTSNALLRLKMKTSYRFFTSK